MTEPTTIDELAFQLEERKAEETKARDARIAAEQALIEAVGLKEEGTTTTKTQWYKISTIAKLSRSFTDSADTMPLELYNRITKVKQELDPTRLKALATEDPKAYQEAIKHIATKPTKPAVKIERIEPTKQAA